MATRHPHLANALRDLRERLGVGADALTADELCDLVDAVRGVENPFADMNADAMGIPVRVCDGVFFWRLTIGAGAWLDDRAAVWWGGERSGRRYFWALVYALAHARDGAAFAGLDTEDAAWRAVRRFSAKIWATEGEILLAMDRVLRRTDGRVDARDNAVDWSMVLARLETRSGIPRHEWMWGRSAAYAMRAYQEASAVAAQFSAAGMQSAPHMRSEADTALEELAAVKARIFRRVKSAGMDAAGKGAR